MIHITLGGLPIVLHAGAPELSEQPLGGSTTLRLSDGAAVKLQHWQKMAGTLSGEGWIPPGLDGLDYSGPLVLQSIQVNSVVSTAAGTVTLSSNPRADAAPWAEALVGDQWQAISCSFVASTGSSPPQVTVEALDGASHYRVCWMPEYIVLASRPTKTQTTDASNTSNQQWSISWEEA